MSEDNFLARWSQRKRQVAEEARKAEQPAPPAEASAPPGEEEPFDLSLLPKLEELTPETDISLFLRKGVPDALRNAALKRMWALDPAIRDYVGDALDYAWDWNTPGGVPGGGELGPGFDTGKMVARIFGDDARDENVIDHVATQKETVGIAHSDPDEPATPTAAEQNLADLRDNAQDGGEGLRPVQNAAPQKKRRHGGAAPSLSPKSIMS